MSLHCLHTGSRLQPAEYESDNEVCCIRCGRDYDLDSGNAEGNIKEIFGGGLPAYFDDPAVICWECNYSIPCELCGEDIFEPDGRDLVVREGVTWVEGNPRCCQFGCAEAGGAA